MSGEMKKPFRLATLTPEEDQAWVKAFVYYLDEGRTDAQADANAWADLQEQFPRLKDFDGAKK